MRARTKEIRERQVRAFVRGNVRAGLLSEVELGDEVRRAVAEELPWVVDPDHIADIWIAEAKDAWLVDQQHWPAVTDYDRLQAAFGELESADVACLQACVDHWAARDLLAAQGEHLRGVAWFMPADVWHAIDEGMLELNLWHASGANVAPGDQLLDLVINTLRSHGIAGHFDEGRIEVAAYWHRRLI